LHNVCPCCGGELVVRPHRSEQCGNEVAQSRIHTRLLWGVSFGVWTFLSLAATAAIYGMYHGTNGGMGVRTIAGMEFSALLTYAPFTPFAFAFAVRYPIQRNNWVKRSLLHVAGGMVFTWGHVVLKGATPYGYWDPAHREWGSALWDSHLHTFRDPWIVIKSMFLASVVDDISGAYVPTVFIAQAVSYYRRLRERELRTTQLEGQLARARLETLKNQMRPHFLFNTLHSISALMLTDVAAADRMMTSLSDLLRMSLEDNGAQFTNLAREMEFLEVYLDIERTRFDDRLRVAFHISPECLDAQVPHLLLQPLVENAVRHGISKHSAPGTIKVVANREGQDLRVWIRDNGPGLVETSRERHRPGLGLSVTRERLSTLYGDKQSCEIHNLVEGGAEVHLRLPFSVAAQTFRSDVMTQG
jgi:two-component system LytT family sensor kinase